MHCEGRTEGCGGRAARIGLAVFIRQTFAFLCIPACATRLGLLISLSSCKGHLVHRGPSTQSNASLSRTRGPAQPSWRRGNTACVTHRRPHGPRVCGAPPGLSASLSLVERRLVLHHDAARRALAGAPAAARHLRVLRRNRLPDLDLVLRPAPHSTQTSVVREWPPFKRGREVLVLFGVLVFLLKWSFC